MALLGFDTETTGLLLKPKAPLEDDRQPNIVQLAAILYDDDFNEVSSLNCIIYPQEWDIPEGSIKSHGITVDKAKRYGVNLRSAMEMFLDMADTADRFVAHNVEYDVQVIQRALTRWLDIDHDPFAGKEARCTMKAATKLVKVLHKNPRHSEDYKFPSLAECYKHFFGKELIGAHDALVDIRATLEVYQVLCEHYGMVP